MPRLLRSIMGVLAVSLLLAGCVSLADMDMADFVTIPPKLVAEMQEKGMTPSDPILIRIFKEESELEVWKRDRSGRLALLKTYPMCRWSGKLGPKRAEGDRQAPEGFYTVTAAMLNPNSQYYLSFNLGYPNRLERSLGYTGDALMVHGACSSSGCYALTDAGIGEIYAIARDALSAGQTSFQVQAFPFRMTPEHMAKDRNDPNMAFWQNLKEGYDIFDVTKRELIVGACGRRYVYNIAGANGLDPLAECPPVAPSHDAAVVAYRAEETRAIQALLASGVRAQSHAYADGGMHVTFMKALQSLGPEVLAKKTSRTSVPISRPEAVMGTAAPSGLAPWW